MNDPQRELEKCALNADTVAMPLFLTIESADVQSPYRRELDGSELPMSKYRGLLEAAPDAMVVVNQGGEIVLLNVQAEKQFGYRRDVLLGQKVKVIIPEGFQERLIADGTRSAAQALAQHTQLTARQIAEESMKIAGKMCIYTNDSVTVEEL